MVQTLRNALGFREEHLAMLQRFLRSRRVAARLANLVFNTVCGTARALRGVERPEKEIPGPAGVCALIAETGLPQCRHYRVAERAAQLRHLGWKALEVDWKDDEGARRALQLATCVLFYRTPLFGGVPALYAEARRLGLPVLYDIDDLIFDPAALEAHLAPLRLKPEHAGLMREFAPRFREAMLAADALLVSTAGLEKYAADIVRRTSGGNGPDAAPPVFVVRNSIADELAAMAGELAPGTGAGDEIRLFYGSGSDTHDADFALIAEAVHQALERNPRLHLHLHGPVEPPPGLAGCAARVHRVPFLDRDVYFRIAADYDIALMPLVPDAFNDAKSDIKYLEASLLGIPSIASPTAGFRAAVRDGEDGFIARSPEEWRERILQLAASPGLRAALGERARRKVLADRNSALIAEQELLPALPARPRPGGERLLLVNVNFGPQTAGGAAMVAQNTAFALLRRGFEVFVFSTGLAGGIPLDGLTRRTWRGITMITVNTRLDDAADHNEKIETDFRHVLWAVQPGLVHFHCLQGMGIGLPEECARAGVPYVITMHDAWWICPRQFMLDRAGTYCGQSTVEPTTCRERCGIPDETAYRRKARLERVVDRAGAVFTPSDFYTEFARRNFPRCAAARTNRNGILLPRTSPPSRGQGPLRFGYLGGKARHKGYFFLAEALRGLRSGDFELLLVDLATAFGQESMRGVEDRALWAGLNVRVVPFVPQEDLDGLYAQMDVLLFPSLWDESFGLTVREAIARGVFVIASDCGGPREAIREGENGLLFPKGDDALFREHLCRVLENREAFTTRRALSAGDIRDVDAQAAELAAVYGKLLGR